MSQLPVLNDFPEDLRCTVNSPRTDRQHPQRDVGADETRFLGDRELERFNGSVAISVLEEPESSCKVCFRFLP